MFILLFDVSISAVVVVSIDEFVFSLGIGVGLGRRHGCRRLHECVTVSGRGGDGGGSGRLGKIFSFGAGKEEVFTIIIVTNLLSDGDIIIVIVFSGFLNVITTIIVSPEENYLVKKRNAQFLYYQVAFPISCQVQKKGPE